MAKVRQDAEGKKIMPQDNEAPKRIQNILELLESGENNHSRVR